MLRALRATTGPIGVAALAERLAIHPNTVRFHLDALEQEGLVARTTRPARGRGRPPVLYRSVGAGAHPARHYELLADVLVTAIADDPGARERAARAAHARGRRYAEAAADGPADPVERLVGYLGEAGFAPDRASADVVELHNCPFREVVDREDAIACDVHAGMMRGALAGWRAKVAVAELEPFVRPGVCRARLARTARGGSGG